MQGLLEQLARLAECRQASPSREALAIFAEELMDYELVDVKVALQELGRKPRGPYQPAFPCLGDVLSAVKSAEYKRTRFVFRRFEKPFVSCGKHISGDLIYVDSRGTPIKGDVNAFPDRRLATCPCVRAWEQEKNDHDRSERQRESEHDNAMYAKRLARRRA